MARRKAAREEKRKQESNREIEDIREQEGGWCGVKAASSTCKVRV